MCSDYDVVTMVLGVGYSTALSWRAQKGQEVGAAAQTPWKSQARDEDISVGDRQEYESRFVQQQLEDAGPNPV